LSNKAGREALSPVTKPQLSAWPRRNGLGAGHFKPFAECPEWVESCHSADGRNGWKADTRHGQLDLRCECAHPQRPASLAGSRSVARHVDLVVGRRRRERARKGRPTSLGQWMQQAPSSKEFSACTPLQRVLCAGGSAHPETNLPYDLESSTDTPPTAHRMLA